MCWGVSGLSVLVLRFPLFTHQHPAQTGPPRNPTAVSNLGQSAHPRPSSLLPPSRPQPGAGLTSRRAAGQEDDVPCAHAAILAAKLGVDDGGDDDERDDGGGEDEMSVIELVYGRGRLTG